MREDRASQRGRISRLFELLFGSSYRLGIARRFGSAMSRLVYTNDELFIHIENQLKLHAPVRRRASSRVGRLVNVLRGENAAEMRLDGLVIKQLFENASGEPPIAIRVSAAYWIEVEELQSVLREAKSRAADSSG